MNTETFSLGGINLIYKVEKDFGLTKEEEIFTGKYITPCP